MGTIRLASFISGVLLVITVAVGCANESGPCKGIECEESLGSTTTKAFAVGGVIPWSLTNGQIHLCFSRGGSSDAGDQLNAVDFAKIRSQIVNTLNNTWGNVPGMDFVSSCTSPAMSINLFKGGGYGNCGFGNGAECNIYGNTGNFAELDSTTVHEVGHGLGLFHEHQRTDTAGLCSREQGILEGCQKCVNTTCTVSEANACYFSVPSDSILLLSSADKAAALNRYNNGNASCLPCSQGSCSVGSCTNGTCTSLSYWGCFGGNPTAGTINTTASSRGNAQARVNDRVVYSAGILLTRHDPQSIMSYCSGDEGRTDANPTPLDMLGMEMLYSSNRTYGLGCGVGCFKLATSLVTSTTGILVSEWVARGSVGVPFRISGTSSDVYSYSVSPLASGRSTVSYTFRDPVGLSRSGNGTVNKSNEAFAAIAGVVATTY